MLDQISLMVFYSSHPQIRIKRSDNSVDINTFSYGKKSSNKDSSLGHEKIDVLKDYTYKISTFYNLQMH